MEPTTTTAATVLNPITAGLLVGGSAYAGYKGAEYIHQRFSKSAKAGLESVKTVQPQKTELEELVAALKAATKPPVEVQKSPTEIMLEQMAAQHQALVAELKAARTAPAAPATSAPDGLLASLLASLMGKVQEPDAPASAPAPAPAAPAPSKEELQMAALMELLSTTAAPKGELSEVEAKLAAAAGKKK